MFRILLFFSIVFLSCAAPKEGSPGDPDFFNIEDFLAEEISFLDSVAPDVIKTATLNNKEEVKELDGAMMNWEVELNQFNVLQIDKAALWEKYKVDTIQGEDEIQIRYASINPKLRVEELILTQRDGKIVQFTARSSVDNLLQSNTRKWSYRSGGKIHIEGSNKILLLEPQEYSVSIESKTN